MRLPIADSRTIRRRLLAILRRRRADFALVFALQLTVALMGVVAPVLIGRTIDAVSQGAGPGPVRAGILVLCAVVVVQTAVGYMGEYRANCLAERVLTELRDRVVWAVTHMPLGTVEAAGTGDMLGRTTYDVEKVQGLLQQGANRILVLAMTIVTTIGAALLTDLRLGAFAVVPVIPLFYAIRWYLRRAIPAYLAVSAVRARMSGVVSETVEQNATADAQSLRPVRVARVDTLIREMWRNERYTGWVRGLFALGMQIIVSLPVLLVVLVGAGMIADGRTTLGTVTAVALYALQLRNPLWIIGWWVDEIQFAAASFARIFGVEQALGDGAPSAGPADDGTPRDGQRDEASAAERENPEISADRQSPNAERTPDAEPADRTPQGPWTDRTPCGGDLAIADVRFSYRDGEEVLHGVSLDVREGERLAIVGPSGAGKSTLGRLVAGINPPSHGSIADGGDGHPGTPRVRRDARRQPSPGQRERRPGGDARRARSRGGRMGPRPGRGPGHPDRVGRENADPGPGAADRPGAHRPARPGNARPGRGDLAHGPERGTLPGARPLTSPGGADGHLDRPPSIHRSRRRPRGGDDRRPPGRARHP